MPRQDSTRSANWMTLRVIALLMVAGIILAGAVTDGGDDEERPPIIVNNGSIVFEPDSGFLGLGDKGSWTGLSADKKNITSWRHDHPKTGPSALRVRATPNDNVCSDGGQTFRTPVTGSSMTITYGPAEGSQSATFSIVNRALQVDFGTAPTYDQVKQRLIAYAGNSDVRIKTVTVGSTTCTFTRRVKLQIQQLR